MKNIVFDIGNTNIKYATFDNGTMMSHGCINGHDFNLLREKTAGQRDRNAIVCSTIDINKVQKELLATISSDILFLTHETDVPISNLYKTPKTLGMDRLAAVIGAYSQSRTDTLVIDLGTAITYDFITNQGEYLGGNISPGIEMRLKALHDYTDRLPLVAKEGPLPYLGENTESAIRCGVIDGIRHEIEGYNSKLSLKYPNLCTFFTGGDCIYFENVRKNRTFADKYLVLKGLNEILTYNRTIITI